MYLIVENHLSYSIALDQEGRFIKVANMGYEVGQTVEEVYPMEIPDPQNGVRKAAAFGAALVACLILAFFSLFQPRTMYASIYVAINPAIRLDVNKEGIVLESIPLNEDGQILLRDYDVKNKDMNTVSKELVDRAIELGFLSTGGTVSIDIDAPDDAWYQKTGVLFRKDFENFLSERISITVEINKFVESEEETTLPSEEEKTTSEAETGISSQEKPSTPRRTKGPNTAPRANIRPAETDDDDDDDDRYEVEEDDDDEYEVDEDDEDEDNDDDDDRYEDEEDDDDD